MFWKIIKTFLKNKGHFNHKDIITFDGKKIITNETQLAEVFNNHYINIAEKSSGNYQHISHVIIILNLLYK